MPDPVVTITFNHKVNPDGSCNSFTCSHSGTVAVGTPYTVRIDHLTDSGLTTTLEVDSVSQTMPHDLTVSAGGNTVVGGHDCDLTYGSITLTLTRKSPTHWP